MQKDPDFRFNRMRKSGKTEFLEVQIERASITHFITVLIVIFRTFFSHNAEEEKKKIKDWMSWTNNHRDPQIYNRAPSEKLSTKYWFTQPKNSGPAQLIWTLLNATLRAQCKAMRCVLTCLLQKLERLNCKYLDQPSLKFSQTGYLILSN